MSKYEYQNPKHRGSSEWFILRTAYKGVFYHIKTVDSFLFINFFTSSESESPFLEIQTKDKNLVFKTLDKKEIDNAILKTINTITQYSPLDLSEFSIDSKVIHLIVRYHLRNIGIPLRNIYIPFHTSEQYNKSKNKINTAIAKYGFTWLDKI